MDPNTRKDKIYKSALNMLCYNHINSIEEASGSHSLVFEIKGEYSLIFFWQCLHRHR